MESRDSSGEKSKVVASELPSESNWINHSISEFYQPDPVLETHYESLLVDSLVDTVSDIGFVVMASDVYSATIHLRKKFAHDYDQYLCGFRLLNASDKPLQILHLFYQFILSSVIGPDSFCVGTLISVPKKDEDSRAIKVSSAICKLLVLLVVKDVNKACSTLDNQFGFMEGFSREHVHYILANVLKDIESSGEFPVYAAHNVFRAFDSGVHSRLLYSAQL